MKKQLMLASIFALLTGITQAGVIAQSEIGDVRYIAKRETGDARYIAKRETGDARYIA